jgi:Pvc16 N-terminal domain
MADELTIIRDVGTTLKELLETNIPTLKTHISFNSPADIQTPAGSERLLSLFLYQLAENTYMRNRNLEISDPARLVYPSIILDLYYLLTPYAKERDDEFDILEKVVRTFYDNAVLRGSNLKGMLLDSGNEELRITSNFLSLEDLNHLWNTFSKSFKPSLAYLITPVRIPSTRELDAHRVVRKEDRYYQILQGERRA